MIRSDEIDIQGSAPLRILLEELLNNRSVGVHGFLPRDLPTLSQRRDVLVQREMDSGRAPLASITPIQSGSSYRREWLWSGGTRCQAPQQAAVPVASRRCVPAAGGCKRSALAQRRPNIREVTTSRPTGSRTMGVSLLLIAPCRAARLRPCGGAFGCATAGSPALGETESDTSPRHRFSMRVDDCSH